MPDSSSGNSPDLCTRFATDSILDDEPAAFRVTWVDWDSDFRNTGLMVGDQIVGLNGSLVVRSAVLAERQQLTQTFPGQYAEAQRWAAAGMHAGDAITLQVRRRDAPSGWKHLAIAGKLKPPARYSSSKGELSIGAGGPENLASDGFNDSWGAWYEAALKRWSVVLDGGWQQDSFNNRYQLSVHLQDKPRIDYLNQHYAGTFAKTMLSDWNMVLGYLQGPKYELNAEAIKFRAAEEDRLAKATALATEAFTAYTKSIAAKTIPPFPAIHPIREDQSTVVGKLLVLPAIRSSNWMSQGDTTFFAFGSEEDGWYFADAESAPSQAMLLALERYRRTVAPNIDESYAMVARVLPTVDLRVVSGVGYYGMEVEIVAAMVGEAMFVDLSKRKDKYAPFAGEELFDMPMHELPPATATPADVMTAFFGALKTGDLKLWQSLFAHWSVGYLEDGRAIINPFADELGTELWENARRTLLKKVYDLRVHWTDDTRSVTTGKEFKGAPHIEEVAVEIDHIGLFDGEYRVFKDVTVQRMWKLQRYDGGPWRITTIQAI